MFRFEESVGNGDRAMMSSGDKAGAVVGRAHSRIIRPAGFVVTSVSM